MAPFALATRFDQAGAPQVGEVAGNPWLIGLKRALQVANADLAVAHEVQEAQAVLVGESGEKPGVQFHTDSYTP
jgi:hypothetical protein